MVGISKNFSSVNRIFGALIVRKSSKEERKYEEYARKTGKVLQTPKNAAEHTSNPNLKTIVIIRHKTHRYYRTHQ